MFRTCARSRSWNMTLAGDVAWSLAGVMGLTEVGIEVRRITGVRALTRTGARARPMAGTRARTGHGAAGEGTRVSSTGDIQPGSVEDIFKLLPESRQEVHYPIKVTHVYYKCMAVF